MNDIQKDIFDDVCDSVSEIWDNIFLIMTYNTLGIARSNIRVNIMNKCTINIQSNIYQHIRIKQKEL
jgi:hypothetical protein